MSTVLVHVGFGHLLSPERIVAVAAPGSAPIKRAIRDAKKGKSVIDLTNGRKTKSVIFTDSQYIVLSAMEPVTINGRLKGIKY